MKVKKRAPIHDASPAGSRHTRACQGPLHTSHPTYLLPRQCRLQRRSARGAQPMPRAGHQGATGCRPALGRWHQHPIVCIGEWLHVCCEAASPMPWHTLGMHAVGTQITLHPHVSNCSFRAQQLAHGCRQLQALAGWGATIAEPGHPTGSCAGVIASQGASTSNALHEAAVGMAIAVRTSFMVQDKWQARPTGKRRALEPMAGSPLQHPSALEGARCTGASR